MSKAKRRKSSKSTMVEVGPFVATKDNELGVYSVRYLKDYEALVEADQLVDVIANETQTKAELVAIILGTTKIIRNLTPDTPDKVDDGHLIASICSLLEEGISPLEISFQFMNTMQWYKIEKILRNPEEAVELFQKYSKAH